VAVRVVQASLVEAMPPHTRQKKCVIEEEWRYTNFKWLEFIKDSMCVVGALIVPDSRMIATHYKVRAGIILSNERVENGFTWTRISHSSR